ncbi:MAG: hypothetical protein DRG31_06955 [Deltaproteobacteria bacterium]|nr:MAG: hypothetical protein DRG31_06955 [Deltaproteobacteria bacterium]
MNVVMIPTYDRPEFLFISLSSLLENKGIEDYKLLFIFEHRARKECKEIASKLVAKRGLDYEFIEWKSFYGLSKGILEGLKIAFRMADEYVIVIEEDVRTSRDFLKFGDYCYRNFYLNRKDIATVSGFVSVEHGVKRSITRVRKRMWYSPYGVLIPKSFFYKYIYPHCTEKYYSDPSRYCDSYYETWIYRGKYTEQAGLINRVIHKNALYCLVPEVPRCQHIGWYGKNRRLYRLSRPRTILKALRYSLLPLDKKVEFTMKILRDMNLLRRYLPNDPIYILEEDHQWTDLELVE